MIIGFIGLGTMGAGMALNVRAAGHDMLVYDQRSDAGKEHVAQGCVWADSVEALATGSDVVLTSLPGPKQIEAVALGERGLLASMRAGTAWFDLSTNALPLVRRLDEAFTAKGIAALDAPVSGGPAGAKTRRLALWVGGPEAAFQRHKPILDAIGDQVLHIGPAGSGTVAKLVHNCASFTIQTVLAEVMTLGVKAGVDPLALWTAIRQGASGRPRTFDRLADQYLPNRYEPAAFALSLAHKDVTLATDLAHELGVPMRLAQLAHADMTEALNRGWGHLDSRVSMTLQNERARVSIEIARNELERVLKPQ